MNFSVQRALLAYVLCFFTTQLFSMEITEVPTKPTIVGKIYINLARIDSVGYISTNYHVKLTQMGIPSCIQNPVIPVIIMGTGKTGDQVCWTEKVSYLIQDYEWDQYKAKHNNVIDYDDACYYSTHSEISQKTLPASIPALYLYKAKTGTVLSFNMYGYPVQLTCSKSFEEGYTACMTAFLTQPAYCSYKSIDPKLELVEHELIEVTEEGLVVHGKKSFVSMKNLITELMEKHGVGSCKFLLLSPFFKKI